MTPPDGRALRPREPDGAGPVFDEPWQAQILAIADALVEHGIVTPVEWSERLGAALADAMRQGAPDTAETYYRAVTTAVEAVLDARGEIDADSLAARIGAWTRAYERTPHGRPVELEAGMDDDGEAG